METEDQAAKPTGDESFGRKLWKSVTPSFSGDDGKPEVNSIASRVDALNNDPEFQGLPLEVQTETRQKLMATLQRQREEDIARRAEAFEKKSDSKPASFVGAAMDTATFGQVPNIVGVIGGDAAEESLRRDLEAAEKANPLSSTAGNVLGYFVGPAGVVGRTASRGASTAAKLMHGEKAIAVGGMGAVGIVQTGLERSLYGRFLAATADNASGAAAAIMSQRLLEDNNGENGVSPGEEGTKGYALGERVHQAYQDATNPFVLGLVGAGAGLQTALAKNADNAFAPIVKYYEKMTGEKIPPEMLQNRGYLYERMRSLRAIPGVDKVAGEVHENILKGMEKIADDIAGRAGKASTARAANAVTTLKGVLPSPRLGEKGRAGAVTLTRRGEAKRGMAEAEASLENGVLPEAVHVKLAEGLQIILNKRRITQEGPGRFGKIIDMVESVTDKLSNKLPVPLRRTPGGKMVPAILLPERAGQTRPTLTVQHLEDLREETAALIFSHNPRNPMARLTKTELREARDLHTVLQQTIEQFASPWKSSLDVQNGWRSIEKAFGKLQTPQLDQVAVNEFFAMKNLPERWHSAEQLSTPADLQALRAWYLDDLVRKIFDPNKGFVDPRELDKVLRGKTRHNREVIEKLFNKQLVEELETNAKFSETFRRGPGASTAGAKAPLYLSNLAAGVYGSAAYGLNLFLNPGGALAGAPWLLGGVGVKMFAQAQIKTMMAGHQKSSSEFVRRIQKNVSQLQSKGALPTPRVSMGAAWERSLRGGTHGATGSSAVATAGATSNEIQSQSMDELMRKTLP